MKKKVKYIKIYTDEMYSLRFGKNAYTDELLITESTIECKRNFFVLDEYTMWKETFYEEELKESFCKIVELVENLKEPTIAACDSAVNTIELVYEDDTKLSEEYYISLSANDMDELSMALLEVIPSGCFYPKFIR